MQMIDIMEKRAVDSEAMLDYWNKTDDIIEGQHAVVNSGKKYLPKFEDESDDGYKSRLTLTKFTNVYRDIVESLASKPFERSIEIEDAPSQITNILDDIDGAGNDLTVFCASVFFNGLNSGLHWIFVDYPKLNDAIKTVADQKKANIRPYWSHVLARNVLEVRCTIERSREKLTYLRMFEPKASTSGKDQIRVFELINEIVTYSVFEKSDKYDDETKTAYVQIDEGTISIPLIPLVPFVTGRRDGRTFKVFPLMQDAADLQIELYQQESGLKFIKTIAAYPMLAANGMRPEMDTGTNTPKRLKRGPLAVLWGVPDGAGNHGSWAFVEPSSQSMEFLAKDIVATKQDLRELGRQPLTAQSGNLTVITTAVAAGKAKSALAALVTKLEDALSQAFYITGLWEKADTSSMSIDIFDDFDDYKEADKDLSALISARENRDISHETYISELKARKVLNSSVNSDDEIQKLLKEVNNETETANG